MQKCAVDTDIPPPRKQLLEQFTTDKELQDYYDKSPYSHLFNIPGEPRFITVGGPLYDMPLRARRSGSGVDPQRERQGGVGRRVPGGDGLGVCLVCGGDLALPRDLVLEYHWQTSNYGRTSGTVRTERISASNGAADEATSDSVSSPGTKQTELQSLSSQAADGELTEMLEFLRSEVESRERAEWRYRTIPQVLGAYRKVICMTRETHCEYPTLETGTRRVIMEMEKEVSNYTQVCGFQGVCRRCGLGGQLSYDCRTPRCTRCGGYSHASSVSGTVRAVPDLLVHSQIYANELMGETPPSGQKTRSHKGISAAKTDEKEVDKQAAEMASAQGGGAPSPLISNPEGADTSSGSEGSAISTEEESAEKSACLKPALESSTTLTSMTSGPESKDDTATGGDSELT
ncbi:hypothetical protein HPB47_015856 [Ixodes persulcatus]|uniref:Uncharacterized protein n=1 Tax=Ixodes persulcatus TaxID=34615 RepID=A0AC60QUZ5_IXOPE|nr:hypothetical protein HPB47_015856 [Ixodes persulcatus]